MKTRRPQSRFNITSLVLDVSRALRRSFAFLIVLGVTCSLLSAPTAQGAVDSERSSPGRLLRFTGVPVSQAAAIKNKFPYVFERPVSLAEVDDIVRWLMGTGGFSSIEVVERNTPNGTELMLVASMLRKIRDVSIEGASAISASEVKRILKVDAGLPFERKELLNALNDDLMRAYAALGMNNPRLEIDFELPTENEVVIKVKIDEGRATLISEVVIDTPNTLLATGLQKVARGLKNRPFTRENVLVFTKAAADYFRANRYVTARLTEGTAAPNADQTQVRTVFGVENPYQFEFRFQGNDHFSTGLLIAVIENENMAGAPSSPAPDMAEKIRRKYQAVGFANVNVSYNDKIDHAKFKHLIEFTVEENPRVRIKKIEIEGNISRPQNYYSQFLKSSSSDLIGQGFYNRKDIDDGAKKLITELQNQGFLRAKVQSSRAEYSADKSSVTITMNIDEGPLTQVRQIRIEGIAAFSRATLIDFLKIKSGAALSLKDLEDSLKQLKEFYKSQGYLEMKILNEGERNRIVSYNDTNTQATIDLDIYEGPQVRVASVEIDGNSFTKSEVILRELSFQKGDVLTPEKIDESTYRLQRLGLFSRVNIRMPEAGSSLGDRIIVVDIDERDPGLFTLGLGVNNERDLTFRGYLGVAYRNIQGTGRALSFRVDPRYSTDPKISYVENKITLSYLEPYIFGYTYRGRLNLTRDQSFSEVDDQGRTIIQEENSIGLLLEKDLTRNIKVTYTGYSFSNQRKFDRNNFDTLEMQNIAKTGPLVEFDFRDDLFNPTRGLYAFVNAEYSDPRLGSSEDATQTIQFFKTNASITHYRRVLGRNDVIWANSVRGGYLTNLSQKANGGVPSQEAFFLGGRSTIRGFDASDLERIPNNLDLGVGSLTDFQVTADSHFYLFKTELRFPLLRNFFGFDLDGAIFYDGGAVLISQPDVHIPDPYRDSAGFGLRIPTPFGPVNAEIGWKLDRRLLQTREPSDLRESPWSFHFSIGAF